MSSRLDQTSPSKDRVQGVTGDTSIVARAGILDRIVVSNANAAVQTLTVKDDTDTLLVIRIPATTTLSLSFGMRFATELIVNPSHADVDALVLYA